MPYNDIAADTRSLVIINSHESKRNLDNYVGDDREMIFILCFMMLQGVDSRRGDPRHYNGHGSGGGGQHHPKQGGGHPHGQYSQGYTSGSSGFKSGHMEVGGNC